MSPGNFYGGISVADNLLAVTIGTLPLPPGEGWGGGAPLGEGRGEGAADSPLPRGITSDLVALPLSRMASSSSEGLGVRETSSTNQIYNVAVGARTTLNQLYEQLHLNLLPSYPHLQDAKPVYRDFRSGDVRHSLADISKAATLLGYQPTHRIGEGLKVAMEWYIQHLTQQGKA